MKRLLFFLSLLACLAFAQNPFKGTPGASIRSLASDPAQCNPQDPNGTNNIYWNTASGVFKYCSALNTWSTIGGGTATAIGAAGNPVASTAATQFGQRYINQGTSPNNFALASGFGYELADWGIVADDSTDNCTAAGNWVTAVNAYTGVGVPTATCTQGVGDIAVALKSCNLAFTRPVTFENHCVLDFGTNSSANGIQLGPTGLSLHTAANVPPYTVRGGSIRGGGSLTNGIIEVEPWIVQPVIEQLDFVNAGSASNTAILIDGRSNLIVLDRITSWNTDATTGRNFYKNLSVGGQGLLLANSISLSTGNVDWAICGGTAMWIGGTNANIVNSEIYGYNIPIRLSNAGGADFFTLIGGAYDDGSCSAGGVAAPIQIGDPSTSGNVGPIIVSNVGFALHGGEPMIAKAADATSAALAAGSRITFNVGGTGAALANSTVLGQCGGIHLNNCYIVGNDNFTLPANIGTLMAGDPGTGTGIGSIYDGSEWFFGPNGAKRIQLGDTAYTNGSPILDLVPSSHTFNLKTPDNVAVVQLNGAGPLSHTLRGNGTAYADAQLSSSDLSDGPSLPASTNAPNYSHSGSHSDASVQTETASVTVNIGDVVVVACTDFRAGATITVSDSSGSNTYTMVNGARAHFGNLYLSLFTATAAASATTVSCATTGTAGGMTVAATTYTGASGVTAVAAVTGSGTAVSITTTVPVGSTFVTGSGWDYTPAVSSTATAGTQRTTIASDGSTHGGTAIIDNFVTPVSNTLSGSDAWGVIGVVLAGYPKAGISASATVGQAVCVKASGLLGTCSSVVGAGGACTCN